VRQLFEARCTHPTMSGLLPGRPRQPQKVGGAADGPQPVFERTHDHSITRFYTSLRARFRDVEAEPILNAPSSLDGGGARRGSAEADLASLTPHAAAMLLISSTACDATDGPTARGAMPVERLVLRGPRPAAARPTYGDLGIAALVVAVLTGILLAIPYDVRDPYASIARLRLTNPAASYFRNVHYWSAQLFLIFTALHVWDHLRRSTERNVNRGVWARLMFAFPLAAFVMLSGFMLKGDAEGLQAWRIISTVTSSVPLVGPLLSVLFFGADAGDLQILYVHHVATASIFLWLLVIEHARLVWPRAVSVLAIFAPVAIVSLFASPGLHDALDPVVKGPWYFLGLQETLHWLSHPALSVVASLVALIAILLLPWLSPRASRVTKIALAAGLGVYLALTGVGFFFRGANWSLVMPDRARATGVDVAIPDTFAGVPLAASHETRALPVVLGRPEGCLSCHADMKGFSPAHDPRSIGCASCHAGNPFTLDKSAAHRGMWLIPGNLADAARTCGTSSCHPAIPARLDASLMTTMAGIVSVDRRVFGEPAPGGAAGSVDRLGHSPADEHLRQLCASCHLGAAKTELGPVHEDSRGGGCNACHLNYSADALDALRRYQAGAGDTSRVAPAVHPSLSLAIGDEHCFGCHSRSGRISTNYEGWMELERTTPDPTAAGRERTLEDGRVFERVDADVHYIKKMECVDCHTAREVMGTGVAHARKTEALEVACEDCHLVGEPVTVPAAGLDYESRRILTLRKLPVEGRRFLTTGATRQPLVNAFLNAEGSASMALKRTGEVLPLKRPAPVCLEGAGHATLTCASCHTAWAPRCSSCHTAYEPNGTAIDLLDGREVSGEWVETGRDYRADPPTLGVQEAVRPDGTRLRLVDTFVPGMIIAIDAARAPGGAPGVQFHRLYARTFSHTIAAKGRSCTSCHNDPEALGYGRGTLSFVREGRQGRWTFRPAHAPSVYDGLPADAWIGFLETRTKDVSTREDVRPFSVEEQRRILTVGACLTCHDDGSAAMRDAVVDWKGTVARVSSRCALPVW
jgi:hypothetical protein